MFEHRKAYILSIKMFKYIKNKCTAATLYMNIRKDKGTEDAGMWAVKLSAGACAALLALAAVGSALVANDSGHDSGQALERPLCTSAPPECHAAADPSVTWSPMGTIDQLSLCNATEIADVNLDGHADIVSSSMLAGIKIFFLQYKPFGFLF